MKATDLMIGDWVYLLNTPCQVKDIIEDGIINYEKDIEPIPLTPEILLKNGLHQRENAFSCCVDVNDCEFYSIKIEFAQENKGAIVMFIVEHVTKNEVLSSSRTTIGGGKEYYVHEFQHKLKQCKIEKEITL